VGGGRKLTVGESGAKSWSRSGIVNAALDLLLPRVCVVCDRLTRRESSLVCSVCWSRLALLPAPRCERCGHPARPDECSWCDLLPPYVRAVRSFAWVPDGVGGKVVHALKYDAWKRIADDLALRMARLEWPQDVVEERTAFVPVPLASRKLRERGFNQSDLIARSLSANVGIPVWTDVLVRTRATRTQTQLTPTDRLSNVAGAFVVPGSVDRRLHGTHLVLVDDVVTTAATLNACAAALHAAGARIISYVTFGRARAVGDRLYL
jgi:ComF family protein